VVREMLGQMSKASLENAIEFLKADTTLAKLGYKFAHNGLHLSLNTILNHIDIEIKAIGK
jgi:hypothetical protein